MGTLPPFPANRLYFICFIFPVKIHLKNGDWPWQYAEARIHSILIPDAAHGESECLFGNEKYGEAIADIHAGTVFGIVFRCGRPEAGEPPEIPVAAIFVLSGGERPEAKSIEFLSPKASLLLPALKAFPELPGFSVGNQCHKRLSIH